MTNLNTFQNSKFCFHATPCHVSVGISAFPCPCSWCSQISKWISLTYTLDTFKLLFFAGSHGKWELMWNFQEENPGFLQHFGAPGHQSHWFSKPDILDLVLPMQIPGVNSLLLLEKSLSHQTFSYCMPLHWGCFCFLCVCMRHVCLSYLLPCSLFILCCREHYI